MEDSAGKHLVPIRSCLDCVAPILAAIPHVGGSLAALWSQWDANRRFDRIEDTIVELRRLICSTAYHLNTEEMSEDDMQILEVALKYAQYANTKEKRGLFAKLVASLWADTHSHPFAENVLFINALSAFNEYHLCTLALINEAGMNGSVPYSRIRDSVVSSLPNDIEKDSVMIPILDMLVAQFGFVHRAWGLNNPETKNAILWSNRLSPEGIARKCNHAITPLGARFVKSLEIET